MIDYNTVQEAKKDEKIMSEIYKKVFFDGKKPKLRMWLIKKGICYDDLQDVETEMKISFLRMVYKYTHDKIEFEKYVWTEFKYVLLNYFQNKKSKKNSAQLFSDLDEDVVFNVGYIPNKYKYDSDDFEFLFTKMSRYEATICRLIYYNNWKKESIINHLDITAKFYDKCLINIRNIMSEYLVD